MVPQADGCCAGLSKVDEFRKIMEGEAGVCLDVTAPVISLSGGNETTHATTQEGGHDYLDPGVVGSDTYDGNITHRIQFNLPDMRAVGTHVITYRLADAAGNAADPKNRTCTVVDTTAPKITIIGEETQEVHLTHEGGHDYVDPGATAYDLVDGEVPVFTRGQDFDNTHVAVHTVTYTAFDAEINSNSVNRTVTVVDTIVPEIELIDAALIRVDAHRSLAYVDKGATASDLVDGNITEKIVMTNPVNLSNPQEEPYIVAFDVTDVAGLQAKTIHRKVIVEDVLPPRLVLEGADEVGLVVKTEYVEAGWSSVDDLDGDVSGGVVVTYALKDYGNPERADNIIRIDSMADVGTVYNITYTSIDAAQNVAATYRTVTILKTPVASTMGFKVGMPFGTIAVLVVAMLGFVAVRKRCKDTGQKSKSTKGGTNRADRRAQGHGAKGGAATAGRRDRAATAGRQQTTRTAKGGGRKARAGAGPTVDAANTADRDQHSTHVHPVSNPSFVMFGEDIHLDEKEGAGGGAAPSFPTVQLPGEGVQVDRSTHLEMPLL